MKKVIISIFLILIILMSFFSTSFATITVTDEDIENSLNELVKILHNNNDYKNLAISLDKENKKIKYSNDGTIFTMDYNLSGKPTFIYEISIEKGMSYEDYKTKTFGLDLPLFGYISVANTQGIKIEDAASYIWLSYLSGAVDAVPDSNNFYQIIDDTTTTEKNNPTDIYISEFGEKVIDYVKNVYSKPYLISDSDELNSYTVLIERKDLTDTSCKLISTLTINPDADFSKLNNFNEKLQDSFLYNDITETNADYVLKLKVGQKCKIEYSGNKIGYAFSNSDCINISENNTLITAKKVGKLNGYLYLNDINSTKTIYIIIEENTDNKTLDTITLKLDNNTKSNNVTSTNTVNSYSKLPQTGDFLDITDILYFLILISIVGIIFLIVPNVKYKK